MAIGKRLRSSFVAGLVLVLPLVVTVVVFRVVFQWTFGFVDPIVGLLRLERVFGERLAAQLATIGVILLAITLLGYVAQRGVGSRALGRVGKVVNFIPVFRTVYGSIRQVASSFSERSDTYDSVVFVRAPHTNVYEVGFVTGEAPPDLSEHAGEPVFNVYRPASPNPTNGRLTLVPESELVESDLTVRQGIRLLMTTGVAATGEELEDAEGRDGLAVELPEDSGLDRTDTASGD